MARPTRLSGISYNNLAAYFVTSVTHNRIKAFDLNDFGPLVARALVAIAHRFEFEVSAYSVMPDHVHFLATAAAEGADFKRMVAAWKQRTGYEWSRRTGATLWQHGYWERVLRDNDNPLSVCRYIIENPVRAGLVSSPVDYPLSGSTQYELRHICEAVQMKGWWRS